MAHKIVDNTGAERSELSAIMAFFGKKPNQSISEFNTELKALSPESKTELAIGAAKELGWQTLEV